MAVSKGGHDKSGQSAATVGPAIVSVPHVHPHQRGVSL
jgi:hypothetical protein